MPFASWMPGTRRPGQPGTFWPLLSSLVVLFLIATVGVLWFMREAVENERLAMRQRLMAAYTAQLEGLRFRFLESWGERTANLSEGVVELSAPRIFELRAREGAADAVVVFDADGEVSYPSPPRIPEPEDASAAWRRARRLEHADGRPERAARAYAAIARESRAADEAARALRAEARCLARAGQVDAALEVLTGPLAAERFRSARDRQGRLIALDAHLRALGLFKDLGSEAFRVTAERLASRLGDYGDADVPAAQRRFLMRELAALVPDWDAPPTFEAEQTAARYLESGLETNAPTVLRLSGRSGLWQTLSPDRRVLGLYRQETILAALRSDLADLAWDVDVDVDVLVPEALPGDTVLLTLPAGRALPGWRLALSPRDPDLFEDAARRRISVYVASGVLVIVLIAGLAALTARGLRRQARLTGLKNDLLATVSHELKAPLSSMRALVETLLDADHFDKRQTREYLELLAKENLRLSRLIESFLTYSRLERGQASLRFEEVAASDLVTSAVRAVGERFESPCRFEVDVEPSLPAVLGDTEALVTVLVNLLDNAYKYTGAPRHVVLRAYSRNGSVCLAVEDNGVGLTQRETSRIFERFYQVDRRLSRSAGGCGLGLAIVRSIVEHHRGSIDVDSRPGRGSTFTVRLPAVEGAESDG